MSNVKETSYDVSDELFEVTSGYDDVPDGLYTANFQGIETFTSKKGYQNFRFNFEVVEGEYTGRNISDRCPFASGPTSKRAKWNCMLLGQPPKLGVLVKPSDHIGQSYRVIVKTSPTNNGAGENKSQIESFSPIR